MPCAESGQKEKARLRGGRFRFLPPSKHPLIETTKAGATPAFESPRHGTKKRCASDERKQGRLLPPLRGSLFGGWNLPNQHNGGEFFKRGYPPLEAFQLGWVKGGEEIAIFPSLVSFSFSLSLGQARERELRSLQVCKQLIWDLIHR